jgi:hypothetical protein
VNLSLNLVENSFTDASVNLIAEEGRIVPLQQVSGSSVFFLGKSAFCAGLQMNHNQLRESFFQIIANIEW